MAIYRLFNALPPKFRKSEPPPRLGRKETFEQISRGHSAKRFLK